MNRIEKKTTMRISMLVGALVALSGCGLDAETETVDIPDPLWASQHLASQRFLQDASLLAKSTNRFCDTDSEPSQIESTKQAWVEAMKAWAPLQGTNVGNEKATSLSWQIQFYPDKKNTTGRQLSRLIKKGGPYSVDSLSTESVAVQGLGAMEWLLFDSANTIHVKENCRLMTVVAGKIVSSAEALTASWAVNPWRDAEEKQRDTDALRLIAAKLATTMKAIELPMGKPGYPKPYQAQAWRSQQSLTVLRASVVHLQRLYAQTLEPILIANAHTELANCLTQHWEAAVESIPDGEGLKALLESKEGYRSLIMVLNNLEYINIALDDEAGPALGMIVGFNSTDGD
ncbi:imelysin family protein [Enterovibrio nigricans]|nr:imelysin family protein [Enterovibrio nigricans]